MRLSDPSKVRVCDTGGCCVNSGYNNGPGNKFLDAICNYPIPGNPTQKTNIC
jgi:hypothetical protein